MLSGVGKLLSSPFVPQGMASTAIFNILPFLLMISVSYDAYLRFQSAKSGHSAKWGALYGGLIVIAISFCAALIGAAGREVYPAINATAVLPEMIQSILSPVLGGIVLAALLAAAMSTANSLVISIAGSCSRDFYNKVLNRDQELNNLPFAKSLSRVVVGFSALLGLQIALHVEGLLGRQLGVEEVAHFLAPGVLFGGKTNVHARVSSPAASHAGDGAHNRCSGETRAAFL